MEPQIIDYYNELPFGIDVIDKMNEELSDLQKKLSDLEKKQKSNEEEQHLQKYTMPTFEIKTPTEKDTIRRKIKQFQEEIEHIITEEIQQCLMIVDTRCYFETFNEMYNEYIQEEDNIVHLLIEHLDELTNHTNKQWCIERVRTTFYSVYLKLKEENIDIHTNSDVDIINIVDLIYMIVNLLCGDTKYDLSYVMFNNYIHECYLLRDKKIVKKSNCFTYHHYGNIKNMYYLKCKECGKNTTLLDLELDGFFYQNDLVCCGL